MSTSIRPASQLVFPFELTDAHTQHMNPAGVTLCGKLVMIRRYTARQSAQQQSSSAPARKRYQLMIVDGVGSMQVTLYRQSVTPDKLGSWIAVGPVDIQDRNASYDSSTCKYSARGRWEHSAATTCVFSPTPPSRMQQHLDRLHTEYASSGAASTGAASTGAKAPPVLMYSPYFTEVADLPSSKGIGCCVNVAVYLASKPMVQKDTGDIFAVGCGKDRSAVEIHLPRPPRFDEDNVFFLDGDRIKSCNPGDIVILLDMYCDMCLTREGVKLQLKPTLSSRIKTGSFSQAVRERVLPEDHAEEKRDGTSVDSAPIIDAQRVIQLLPCVDTLRSGERNLHVNVVGTIAGVSSSQPGYTRTRYQWNGGEGGEGSAVSFCEGGGDDMVPEAGGGNKTITKFDVITSFDETPRELRWCDAAAATLLIPSVAHTEDDHGQENNQEIYTGAEHKQDAALLAARFSKLPEEEKQAAAESVVGRVAAMRVWCKPDGGQMLVMSACVFPKGICIPRREDAVHEDHTSNKKREFRSCNRGDDDDTMLLAL